jgi:hypothetical protein
MGLLIPGQPVPSGVAWRALIGTGIAAFLGVLSLQAHSLTVGDIGGSLRLSADDTSRVTTAGSMSEGAAVLVASPLCSAFSARWVVVGAARPPAALDPEDAGPSRAGRGRCVPLTARTIRLSRRPPHGQLDHYDTVPVVVGMAGRFETQTASSIASMRAPSLKAPIPEKKRSLFRLG